MGKGERAHLSSSTLNFSRSLLLDNGVVVSPQQPLPALLDKTTTTATSTISSIGSIYYPNERNYRWKSVARQSYKDFEQKMDDTPLYISIHFFVNYIMLVFFGYMRDVIGKFFKPNQYSHIKMNEVDHQLFLSNSQSPLIIYSLHD